MTRGKRRMLARVAMLVALLVLTVAPARLPLYAQAAEPIGLDEGGFGMATVDSLEAEAAIEFTLDLMAGDRVAMDLQGESDALAVSAFEAPWGALALEGVPEAFNYLAWAPEDGTYTVVVANSGDDAAGFVLRVAVSPAPLPTQKILTLDADGQTIPIAVGEAFQVALDAPGDVAFPWQLDAYDVGVVSEAGGSSMVLLGTMPGAMRQEIFTFVGLAPGTTTLTFTNDSASEGAPAAFAATIEVTEAGDDMALGLDLVTQFFDALQAGDRDAVGAMLAPAFQLMRASGESFDAGNYLDNLPVYAAYTLSDVRINHNGDVLVVAYQAATDTTMDGGAAEYGAPAPRLSTFQQIDGAWKLLSHANFATPEAGAPVESGDRTVITTDAAPAPIGPYAQAIEAGDLLFISGQLGLDPATGTLAEGVEAQTHQALANVEAILAAAGAGPDDVVKVTLYLADMADFEAVNAIYAEVFQDAPPARSTVQVAALPRDARIEIEVVALLPQE